MVASEGFGYGEGACSAAAAEDEDAHVGKECKSFASFQLMSKEFDMISMWTLDVSQVSQSIWCSCMRVPQDS